jgi:hypothetical protein
MELAANLKVVGWLLQSIGREGIRPREGYTHVAIVLKLARFMLVLCYGLVVARNFKRVSQEPVSFSWWSRCKTAGKKHDSCFPDFFCIYGPPVTDAKGGNHFRNSKRGPAYSKSY